MKKSGEITVFLSLILMCICGLLCGLLESARTTGARGYLRMSAYSSMDSLLSRYHRELWNEYRLLFLEFDDESQIEGLYRTHLETYLEADNFYPMEIEDIHIKELVRSTDLNGACVEQEILEFMKFGILDVTLQPDSAVKLFHDLKEAVTIATCEGLYRGNTKQALQLEKAIEAIAKSLNRQKEHYTQARACLGNQDGGGFRREAHALIGELNKLPKMVKTYQTHADRLQMDLEKTREQYVQMKQDLSEATQLALEEEMAQYEAYTAKDGDRRIEIVALEMIASKNEPVVQEAIEMANRVEEIIDDWESSEDSEDGDELDEEALWRSVSDYLGRYEWGAFSYEISKKDTEKQSILERIEQLSEFDLLNLVLPEGTIVSKEILDLTQAPSKEFGLEFEQSMPEGTDLIKNLVVNEYCGRYFLNFLTSQKKEVQYELEYLLGKKAVEEENLKEAVKQILAVREGLNFLHILSSKEKREEARVLALTIVGASGLAPLVSITSFFIMGVWALGESICDVKALLSGLKVPFIKTETSWNLSLEGLLDLGKNKTVAKAEHQENGFDYTMYLKFLLLMKNPTEKYYQMMDIMQMNIRRKQADFLMKYCAYDVEIESAVYGKHVFLSLDLWKGQFGTDNRYRIRTRSRKAY